MAHNFPDFKDLPAEILERVFWFLDGESFIKISKVCKQWQQITKQMEKNFWKVVCLEEMDLSTAEQLVGYRNDFKEIKKHIWKKAYMKWLRGSLIHHKIYRLKSISVGNDNPITCIKISGSWVLSGHMNGSVYSWNQLTGEVGQVLMQHLLRISDFLLVDILHCGPYGTPDNAWDHHHIISVSKDPTIQVNSLLTDSQGIPDEHYIAHYHGCGSAFIRSFEKLVATAACDNTILLFSMEYLNSALPNLRLTLLRQIIGPSEILRSFHFWRGEFQCFCINGARKLSSIDGSDWQTIWPYYMATPGQDSTLVRTNMIINSFTFRDNTIFLTTPGNKLLISIDGKNYHQIVSQPTVTSAILCVALHGPVLAFGTETGQLLVYHVPKLEDLLNMKIETPCWSKYLSEASILYIDIFFNDGSPVLAACTTEKIFVIRWLDYQGVTISKRKIDSSLFTKSLDTN